MVNTSNDPFNNKFNFELDQIEIELGNVILPGVRKFKSTDDELRFITYMYEGYRGKNSNILTNFNEKYPPEDLSNIEKMILRNFINNFNQDEYKNFLFSIQILINYIQNSGKSEDTPIDKIILDLPEHVNIDEKIKYLFSSNKEMKINKLVRIFEFFEHLCWEQIKENLLDEFTKPLSEEKIKLTEDYYGINKENYIKRIELAGAIRKFISRYLAGKRSQSEIGEDKMLFDYLTRVDLWERNIDDEKFEKEFFQLSKFKISVGEGKDFYDKLGGDNNNLNLFFNEEEFNKPDKNEKMDNNLYIEETNKNEIIIYTKKKKKDNEKSLEEYNDERKNEINQIINKGGCKKRKLF